MYFTPEFLAKWHRQQARLRMEQVVDRDSVAFTVAVERMQKALEKQEAVAQRSLERQTLIMAQLEASLAFTLGKWKTRRISGNEA